MHLSKCFSVSQVICLASVRTFFLLISSVSGQCHPSLPLLQAIFGKLLIAAYAKQGISVIWLEMLHIWMWRGSCFSKAVTAILWM